MKDTTVNLENYVEPKESSEEEYIEYHLLKNWIKYEREFKLNNLRNDSKSYRLIDFYLPRLGIYVEYFGMYNSSKADRERYEEKRRVLFNNHLKTVILYPHELGFLEYALHTKIIRVLSHKKFYNWALLLKYKLTRLFHKTAIPLILFMLGIFTFFLPLSNSGLSIHMISMIQYFGYAFSIIGTIGILMITLEVFYWNR